MNEVDLLHHIYQTAEMGVDGIDAVRGKVENDAFGALLDEQREEYRRLKSSAALILQDHGVEPKGIGTMAKLSSEAMSTMKTLTDHSTAKLAEMMIQGSTMGVTKSMRTLRDCHVEDEGVQNLGEQLLKVEQRNIQQLKRFL